jgi:hypothetical protein
MFFLDFENRRIICFLPTLFFGIAAAGIKFLIKLPFRGQAGSTPDRIAARP